MAAIAATVQLSCQVFMKWFPSIHDDQRLAHLFILSDVIRVVVNSINLDGTQMTVNVVPKVVGKYTLCATILTGSTYTPKYTALASTPLTISRECQI